MLRRLEQMSMSLDLGCNLCDTVFMNNRSTPNGLLSQAARGIREREGRRSKEASAAFPESLTSVLKRAEKDPRKNSFLKEVDYLDREIAQMQRDDRIARTR